MDEERNELRGSLGPLSVAVIGLGTIEGTVARHLLSSDILLTACDARPEVADEYAARKATPEEHSHARH